MAQFIARIQGQRGEVSRLGSKNSGIDAHVNGWNAGVKVVASHEDGHDVFHVYVTGGSGYSGVHQLVATIQDNGTNAPSVEVSAKEAVAR